MARPALRTHPRQMVLEEISMIKNELLVGYTREAEEAEEAAAAAMPATATPARPAALSTATGSALTVETVRYAPPEASAASATAASAAVAAAMAQAEQLQWRTAAYPTHVGGACGGLGDGSGGGGGGGGDDDVVWGEIVTGEPVGGAMGGARLPSALPHGAPPQQLCLPVPPLVPSSVPTHLPQGYLPSFAPVPSGLAPPPLLAPPHSQPHGSAGMLLPSYAAAGGYPGSGGGGGGGGACGLDFSMPPGGGGGYGGGGGGGGAYLTAPPSQLPGAGAGALRSDLAQLNLMGMSYGSSLQPAAPPPRAPPPTQGYAMRAAGLDFSMPGLCAPCATDGAAIAPGVPATMLALERHAPAPVPAAYPTVLPPAAQPLTAPVGAGGLRALLIPRSTARVFLQLAADNTARNVETCAILVGKPNPP